MPMFVLTDTVLERIVFAMEDQSHAWLIDLETGDLVAREEVEEPSDRFAEPPLWTSRQGFKLLETFSATVSPPALRAELVSIIRRGKGVFKAFRQHIGRDENLLHRFQQFKLTAMRPLIEEWMARYREGSQLARLGEEPEDLAELVRSEMEIRTAPAREAPFDILSALAGFFCSEENDMPMALYERGREALQKLFELEPGRVRICHAGFDPADPLALGLYMLEPAGGHAYGAQWCCMLYALGSRRDSAALGLEWAVLERIEEEARQAQAVLLAAEGPFLAQRFVDEAANHGFMQTGSVYWKRLD